MSRRDTHVCRGAHPFAVPDKQLVLEQLKQTRALRKTANVNTAGDKSKACKLATHHAEGVDLTFFVRAAHSHVPLCV